MKVVEQVAARSSQNALVTSRVRSERLDAERQAARFEAAFERRTEAEREAQALRDSTSAQERTQARLDDQREAFNSRLAEGRQSRGAIIDGYA